MLPPRDAFGSSDHSDIPIRLEWESGFRECSFHFGNTQQRPGPSAATARREGCGYGDNRDRTRQGTNPHHISQATASHWLRVKSCSIARASLRLNLAKCREPGRLGVVDAEQRGLLATLGSTLVIVGTGGVITLLLATSRSVWVLATIAGCGLIAVVGLLILAAVGVALRRARAFRAHLLAMIQEGDALRASLTTEDTRGKSRDYKLVSSRLEDEPRVADWTNRAAALVGERSYFKTQVSSDAPALVVLPQFMDERLDELQKLLARL